MARINNEVWKYKIYLKEDAIEKIVYTKPFPKASLLSIDEIADFIEEKYFTKERIEELKKEFIKKIQDSENPFDIYCTDVDSGYDITEKDLFDLEK